MMGATLMASYDIMLPRGVRLQPGLKAELLDTDLEEPVGREQVYPAVVNTYFTPTLRLLVEAEQWIAQPTSPDPSSMFASTTQFLDDRTQFLVQLQLAI
jgi:hypothetical protein